jgi:hypothetical protein
MSRAIDVALISALAFVILAKLMGIPAEIGVPAVFAGAVANGWRSTRPQRERAPNATQAKHIGEND